MIAAERPTLRIECQANELPVDAAVCCNHCGVRDSERQHLMLTAQGVLCDGCSYYFLNVVIR